MVQNTIVPLWCWGILLLIILNGVYTSHPPKTQMWDTGSIVQRRNCSEAKLKIQRMSPLVSLPAITLSSGNSPSEPFKTGLAYQGQCLSAIKKSGQINVKGWDNAGSGTSLSERPLHRAWVSVWWEPVWSWDVVRVMAQGQGLCSPGGTGETPRNKVLQ